MMNSPRFPLFIFLLAAFIAVLLHSSCERDITIDLPIDEQMIVVEGCIEAGEAPRVLLSRNRGFFEPFPTDLLDFVEKFIVQDAVVTISDGTQTETLQFVVNPLQYPYVYYTTTVMKGEAGKSYTLTVQAEGKTLRSVTRIHPPIKLDTTYFKLNIFNVNEDSLGFVFGRLTDPDTLGNGYRIYSKKNSESEFFPVDGSAFNDLFINGRTFEFFLQQSTKPFPAQDTFIREQYYYTLGDTIYLKFCTMGLKEVEFFETYEAARGTNGNPFSSPILIKSNIEGGLGVWYGIAATYDTLIAVK